jgi:hypothetical protein
MVDSIFKVRNRRRHFYHACRFILKMIIYPFTKTGLGQAYGKLKTEWDFIVGQWQRAHRRPAQMGSEKAIGGARW